MDGKRTATTAMLTLLAPGAVFWLWIILISGSPDLIDGLVYWLSNGALK
jgi:hypothetical protein